MTVTHEPTTGLDTPGRSRTRPAWVGFTEWLLGIAGGIATFLGFFILFGPVDEYVGIGGDLSWRVGDISSAWTYGLLLGGIAAVLVALALVFFGPKAARPRGEVNDLGALLWHAGVFVLVNAFIWVQDIAIGGGVDYAFWVTIPWGIGLAIHALVYYFTERRVESHQPLVEEKPKEPLMH